MSIDNQIKGILVHFFREGTENDYLDALKNAIEEIKQLELTAVVQAKPEVCGLCKGTGIYKGNVGEQEIVRGCPICT